MQDMDWEVQKIMIGDMDHDEKDLKMDEDAEAAAAEFAL